MSAHDFRLCHRRCRQRGLLLADKLSEFGASVAVIEAGGRDRHPYLHLPQQAAVRWIIHAAAQLDAELLAFAATTGGTVYHPSCTVRMGGDGGGAPLDPQLRLRGVEGLRVVDASVFSDIPVCNINATVLAVAHQAAGTILNKN